MSNSRESPAILFIRTIKFFRRHQTELIVRMNRIAGLSRELLINFDEASHDGSFGFFPAFAKAALDQRLIEARHSRVICRVGMGGGCREIALGIKPFKAMDANPIVNFERRFE